MNKNEDRGESGFSWPVVIKNPNARASLDYYYGPYASEEDMRDSVPNELWVPGFTAAVQSEDGTVEEWWVQGEGAAARFVKKHELEIPDGSMRFMGHAGSMENLNAKENPSKGDVWQVGVKNGRYSIYPLYVYTGSYWAPFSQNYRLTVKLPDGSSKIYDGSEPITVELSKFATADDLDKLKGTCVTVDQLDGFATWKDGDITLLGQNLSDHSIHFRTPQNEWADTGVKLGTDAGISDVSRISGSETALRLSGKDVGLARNGNSNYYRANPLVLAVRITTENWNNYYIESLYNPFGIGHFAFTRVKTGIYTFTHNLGKYGICKVNSNSATTEELKDRYLTYTMIGDARAGNYNWEKQMLYVSTKCRKFNEVDFYTADDYDADDFTWCDLMFFDFNTL